MITGVHEESFNKLFPQAIKVGKSFPIYLLEINGESCEIAFARQERKTGAIFPTSHYFKDDPIRALRAARQAIAVFLSITTD